MDLCLSAREHVVRCHVANRAVQSHVGEMEKSQPHFSLDAILWSEAEKNLKVQDHRAVRPHAGILAPRFTKLQMRIDSGVRSRVYDFLMPHALESPGSTIQIGEAAQQAKLSIDTIRFYERR